MSTRTYLLRTRPQGEKKAIDGLQRCGHVAWTPTEERVSRVSRHAKRKRIKRIPLCARYVIAETDDPHGLVHDVEEVTGVVGALRSPDVDRLRAMDGQAAVTTLGKALAVGQQIRVRSGPFVDHAARIDAIEGDMARLEVYLFGRPTPVTMPLAFLDPV